MLRDAEKAVSDRGHDASDATRTFTTATTVTNALTGEDRLAALLGTDEVLLDTDTPGLLDRLAEAITEAETEQTGLRLADRADQHVLDALGTGGLLPPPADVSAVKAALEAANIGSYAGWEYLAQMPEPERDQALTAHPQLIDGVVLNNPARLDQARQVLTDARLLPRSIVAIGTTAAVQNLGVAGPDGIAFLVPPNPAMYDEDLAETERQHLVAVLAERRTRIGALGTQIDADRRLTIRLEQWLTTYPPGTLARLEQEQADAAEARKLASDALTAARVRADEIAAQEQDLAARLPGLRAVATAARALTERLDLLVGLVSQIPGWTESIRVAREAVLHAEAAATEASEEAERVRHDKEETIRLGDDRKRVADACRTEFGQTPGGGSATLTGAAPTDPVESLRSAYKAAVAAYERVQVGADLRADLDNADKAESELRAGVEALKPTIRKMASDLLDTADGGDSPARSAATSRAERAAAELTAQV